VIDDCSSISNVSWGNFDLNGCNANIRPFNLTVSKWLHCLLLLCSWLGHIPTESRRTNLWTHGLLTEVTTGWTGEMWFWFVLDWLIYWLKQLTSCATCFCSNFRCETAGVEPSSRFYSVACVWASTPWSPVPVSTRGATGNNIALTLVSATVHTVPEWLASWARCTARPENTPDE